VTDDKQGKRDPVELWRVLEEQAALDDLEEIEAMSDEELDAHITANGGDPKKIRADGEALAKALMAQRDANRAMAERLEAFRTEAAAHVRSRPALPRAALLARLDAARKDPRFAEPVAMLFQKKTAEASTDAELQALVDSIDLLSKIEEA
jgi:hypothetical protein